MGDFNASSLIWDDKLKRKHSSDSRANKVIDFLNNSDYVIMNNGSPTRISTVFNHSNSAIDLTIVHKDLFSMYDWQDANMDYGSDHLPICLKLNGVQQPRSMETFWDYKKTDWETFNRTCNFNTIFEGSENSTEIIDDRIVNEIIKALKSSTPNIKPDYNKQKKNNLVGCRIN